MTIALCRRILSYLKPHGWTFAGAAAASAAFAALDAFSFVLLIPFLGTVFAANSRSAADGGAAEADGTGASAVASDPAAAAEGAVQQSDIERDLAATVGRFVDLDGDPQSAVTGIIVFILIVVACKNVVDFLCAYLTARVEQGVTRDLRNRVYSHLLALDLSFFGRVRTGQVVSRLTHDVEQLRTLVTKELVATVSSVFMFAATLYFMVQISARLTAAAFVVIPLTMVIWGPLVKRLRRGDRRVLDMAGEVSAHIQETISGIRLVKSSAAENREQARFRELTGAYFATFMKTVRLRALAAPFTEFLVTVGTAILLWYGAKMVVTDGVLSGELFVGFVALSAKLYAPVKYISKLPVLVQPGLVGAERVFEFLDAPPESRDVQDPQPFNGAGEGIRYRDVGLAYRKGDWVLRDIDFFVPAGTTVALVGPSGAGKTSIVDLLGRFYDPTAGAVEIAGRDLRAYSLESLRRNLGVVSQETVLFHDTVRANIAYGSEGASDRKIIEAARAARAHDFIERLPEGYRTVVGERGATLSGGQRQRIAIARAILRDPPVLVLDEATSALDTESERQVQKAVARLLAGRTVFVIAHRLSTIRRADMILVVDEGRIVQRGTHESLVREGGVYGRLRELHGALAST